MTKLAPKLTAGAAVTDSVKISGYFPPTVATKGLQVCQNPQRSFAAAYKAGGKIAFGTDARVYTHDKNYLEFQYITQGGMTNMEAIRTATINAAGAFGVSKKKETE